MEEGGKLGRRKEEITYEGRRKDGWIIERIK